MPDLMAGIGNVSPADKALELVNERSLERIEERRRELEAREEAIRMRAERHRAQREEAVMQGLGTVVDIRA